MRENPLPIDHHIWVSASAGTGKTYALTQRVLQLLLSGARPSGILCLTYTNAAAAEMKERVMGRLGAWVISEEAALTQELEALTPHIDEHSIRRARSLFFDISENPSSLNIQTIHGFCQSILRRFPLEAGVSPYFKVIDEEISKTTTEQAFDQLLSDLRHANSSELAQAMDALMIEMSDTRFRKFISDAIGDGSRWRQWLQRPGGLAGCKQQLQTLLNLDDLNAPQVLFNQQTTQFKHQLFQLIAYGCSQKQVALKTMGNELEALVSLVEAEDEDIEAYCEVWLKKNEITPKVFGDKIIQMQPELASIVALEIQRCQAYRMKKENLKRFESSYNLYVMMQGLFDKYEAICRQYGYLDYHDLLVKTKEFLSRDEHALGWVMYKLDGGIDHVLVDEAQDTNPLQWSIIKAITAEYFSGKGRKDLNRTLFIVGDEKQSIFGFQDANLDYYRSVKHWLLESSNAAGQAFYEHKLLTSRRSAPEVIDAVNQLTAHLKLGEPHRVMKQEQGLVEIWPLTEPGTLEEKAEPATHMLAAMIAEKIQQWLAAPDSRSAEDIMVLVRKRSELSVELASQLRKRSIAVQGVERMILPENLAVRDILSLIQWCLLEADDYSLACVLRSPICGISEEALFELAHGRGELNLWQRLNELADSPGLQDNLQLLQHLRQAQQTHSIYAFIYELLYTHDAANRFIQRMGYDITIPLKLLLEKASHIETQHAGNYQYFVEHIRTQQHAITSKETVSNCVRIMTVHGSKGLEAPIVILADSTTTSQSPSGFEWIHVDSQKMPIYLPATKLRSDQLKSVIAQHKMLEDQENQRLLYVAMTRAKEELYIAGVQPSQPKSGHWYELLGEALLKADSSVAC